MAYEVRTETVFQQTRRIESITDTEAREQAIQLADADVDPGITTVRTRVVDVKEVE